MESTETLFKPYEVTLGKHYGTATKAVLKPIMGGWVVHLSYKDIQKTYGPFTCRFDAYAAAHDWADDRAWAASVAAAYLKLPVTHRAEIVELVSRVPAETVKRLLLEFDEANRDGYKIVVFEGEVMRIPGPRRNSLLFDPRPR